MLLPPVMRKWVLTPSLSDEMPRAETDSASGSMWTLSAHISRATDLSNCPAPQQSWWSQLLPKQKVRDGLCFPTQTTEEGGVTRKLSNWNGGSLVRSEPPKKKSQIGWGPINITLSQASSRLRAENSRPTSPFLGCCFLSFHDIKEHAFILLYSYTFIRLYTQRQPSKRLCFVSCSVHIIIA